MGLVPKAIQGLILFSTLLGAFFLHEVQPPVLPSTVFDFLAVGWVLFLVDSLLTFVSPKISYYLGVVLAVIALLSTVSQPEHYQLIMSGNVPASATLFLGTGAEVLLILFGGYFILTQRKEDPWAWPGQVEPTSAETGRDQPD